MKLNYLLAAAPFVAFSMAAPSPEVDSTPDLEARDGPVIGRISSLVCGDVSEKAKGKVPTTSGKMWFMFTYTTTCHDGTVVHITADQSCHEDEGFWHKLGSALLPFDLTKFSVDKGDYKGKFSGNVDLFSSTLGSKVSFNGGSEIALHDATNLNVPNDHQSCLNSCGGKDKLSVDGDGTAAIWDNISGIPKDFGCEKHGGGK
ncbi:MAG: hypothetical protein M1812_006077 [Candelaria pacifica]|nr:MAG: hypothetical protein M1812_006077 [Candelaria pacifica]